MRSFLRYEDVANRTWTVNPPEEVPLWDMLCIFIAFSGLPPNCLIICLTFSRRANIQGNYKYLLANWAFCDLSFCLGSIVSIAFHAYHALYMVPVTMFNSTLLRLPYNLALLLTVGLSLVSINRYVVVV